MKNEDEAFRHSSRNAIILGSLYLGLTFSLVADSQVKSEPDVVRSKIENSSEFTKETGLIKNGNELIPFYVSGSIYYTKYYRLDTGEYLAIGDKEHPFTSDYEKISKKIGDKVLYTNLQVFSFDEVYPNVYLNAEIVSNFGEEEYRKYEEKFLNEINISKKFLNHYELENITTGEVKLLIGFQVSETQFFDFETYKVEEYLGYNINCTLEGKDLEQPNFSYKEVLDMLEEFKEKENSY